MTDVDRRALLRALEAAAAGAARNASRNGTARTAAAAAASASAWLANASLAGGGGGGLQSALGPVDNGSYHGNITTGSAMGNRYWVLIMFLVPVFTIFGNILVVLAVYRERGLQSVTNYFIVSLAFADILVAAIVMPVSVYVEVRNGYWDFSDTLCDLWIMCDALFSTASILNLVAISIDRFIAVTQPIKYAKHKNSKRTHVTIAGSWLLSIGIALPIGCGLQNLPGVRYDPKFKNVCTFFNGDFLIYSSLGSFYIPCIVMLVLYHRIFTVIRARAQKAAASRRGKIYENPKASGGGVGSGSSSRHHRGSNNHNNDIAAAAASASASASLTGASAASVRPGKKAVLVVRANPRRPHSLSVSVAHDCLACRTEGIYTGEAPIPHTCGAPTDDSNRESPIPLNESQTLAGPSTSDNSGAPSDSGGGGAGGKTEAAPTATIIVAADEEVGDLDCDEAGGGGRKRLFKLKLKKNKPKKKRTDRSAARREKKATKTLAIVLGVFLLCWLPFFITNLMWAACLKNINNESAICIYDRRINVFIVWLGYVNSFLNPLIYTIFNTEFRKAFKKILHID